MLYIICLNEKFSIETTFALNFVDYWVIMMYYMSFIFIVIFSKRYYSDAITFHAFIEERLFILIN